MRTKARVVDNRVFVLGLDDLFRESMKRHERSELLQCAQDTASALSVAPADVPIEGYYVEDELLTEYFRLVRALQRVPQGRESQVASMEGYKRLKHVIQSPIFGPPFQEGHLLTLGEDAMSIALKMTFPDWNIENITNRSYECARDSDDCSLVALAALAHDAVVLAALRESVVLYAMAVGGCGGRSEPEYVWQVDDIVELRAQRFVETFNELFQEELPKPSRENAEDFWHACQEWKIVGRCVRVGFDDRVRPTKEYHWAIDSDVRGNLSVRDFWDTEIWTTQRYREETEKASSP